MTINQFLKSLGLEHLRDIFQREQVKTHLSSAVFQSKHFLIIAHIQFFDLREEEGR